MDILERVKKICLTPQTEWSVISSETTPTAGLITGYVLPLAAVSAVAGLIGGSMIGQTVPLLGTYRIPLTTGLSIAVFAVCTAVIAVFVMSFIINALAPSFSAEKNSAQALKVAVYSFTPAWVAGVFQILPALGLLAVLGALYGLYLLYLGLPRLMKCPQDKAVGYTVVVVICAIVTSVVLGVLSAAIVGTGMAGSGGLSGIIGGPTAPSVATDPNSPLGRLGQIGQALEESAKKAEAAEKAGDTAGQAAAALETVGALLGGGKRVDPLELDQLKPFVPETFGGLQRTSSNAEKTGAGIIMVSKAEATYGDGDQSATLEITDSGGVSGLMGLASWMGVQEERESDDGYERTRKVDGRMTHEKSSRSSANEFAIVIGERFMVSARSRGLDVNALKAAVSGLELQKLESLKGQGLR
jgi:Yip1 domain